MGKFYNGVLGTMTGKVGGVVGRTWKGINTVAAYQPNVSNPRTNLQVAQREKMAAITMLASLINTSFIKPLWDRFAKGMSGYNAFIQSNIAAVSNAGVINFPNLILSKGKMIATAISNVESFGVKLQVEWEPAIVDSYSMSTDKAYFLAINQDTKEIISSAGLVDRSVGKIEIPINNIESGNWHCYLSFKRTDGTIVSNSSYLFLDI
jgi:hypothetical protein